MSYKDVVLASSPSALWMLDETSGTTWVDSVGGRNGTTVVSSTSVTPASKQVLPGEKPSALFNGGGYIEIPDNDLWSPHAGSTGVMTLELVSNTTVGFANFTVCKYGIGNYEWYSYVNDSAINLQMLPISGGTVMGVGSTTPNCNGRPLHVAFTYDRAAPLIAAYADGVLVASSTTVSGVTSNGTTPLRIGSTGTADGQPAFGGIAAVAIYPRVLSASEIKAHAKASMRGAVVSGGYG